MSHGNQFVVVNYKDIDQQSIKMTKRTPPVVRSGSVQSRRRKTDNVCVCKGLRYFSMKVCEKVKEKGITTHKEVANELVQEEIDGVVNYKQKNIRRRIYDAFNVLMAINIIARDKKEIRWIGLPTNSMQLMEQENQKRKERIEEKHKQLTDLLLKYISFRTLMTRNKDAENRGIIPTSSSAIKLPFTIVNTHKNTQVNCCVSNDKFEYYFQFEDKFVVHNDVDVLKLMRMSVLGLDKGECINDDIEKAKKIFHKYIDMYGTGLVDDGSGMGYGPNDGEGESGICTNEITVDENCEDDLVESNSDVE